MDNSLLIGLQSQRVLQRRMDVTANNLANMSTTGFKADALLFDMQTKDPARSRDAPRDIRFVRDVSSMRDMSQGALAQTGDAFDLAIEGEGFFTVGGPGGPLYTRDGSFSLGADGTLSTRDGRPVLNTAGAPIVFDPQGAPPRIDTDGTVRVGGAEVGRIAAVAFPAPDALEKVGDNLFAANGQASGEADGAIIQGAREASNVRPILEMTRLIEISRAYEQAARIVKNGDDLRKSAIDRLGRG